MTLTLPPDLTALLDAKTPPGESRREVAIAALRRGLTIRAHGRTARKSPSWLHLYKADFLAWHGVTSGEALTVPADLAARVADLAGTYDQNWVALAALKRGLSYRKLGRAPAVFTGLPSWLAPYEAEVRDESVPLSVIAEKTGRTKQAVMGWRRKVLG